MVSLWHVGHFFFPCIGNWRTSQLEGYLKISSSSGSLSGASLPLGDIWKCPETCLAVMIRNWRYATGIWWLEPELLPYSWQCAMNCPQLRITWLKMSMVPRLRNLSLAKHFPNLLIKFLCTVKKQVCVLNKIKFGDVLDIPFPFWIISILIIF